MRTRVCIVTGTRAEYGLFRPLLRELDRAEEFEPFLLVTGAHLSAAHGFTVREIEVDGFPIAARVPIPLESDTELGVATSTGLALTRIAEALAEITPDLVVVLGDRYETLAAATASLLQRIPLAHIHGGELTEGAIDDAIRHAITKMSFLHFAATEEYRRRVVQLGEDPRRVFNVGALGIDAISEEELLGQEELESEIGFELGERSVLVTFHPVTLLPDGGAGEARELLATLSAAKDLRVLFTMPNADAHNLAIRDLIGSFVAEHSDRSAAVASLGSRLYLSAAKLVDAVVGNSSSGIIEAPALGTPTVNVGDRQHGRVRPPSVIDCEATSDAIASALARAMLPEFREVLRGTSNPYGDGHTSQRIVAVLRDRRTELADPRKRFFDIDRGEDEA